MNHTHSTNDADFLVLVKAFCTCGNPDPLYEECASSCLMTPPERRTPPNEPLPPSQSSQAQIHRGYG